MDDYTGLDPDPKLARQARILLHWDYILLVPVAIVSLIYDPISTIIMLNFVTISWDFMGWVMPGWKSLMEFCKPTLMKGMPLCFLTLYFTFTKFAIFCFFLYLIAPGYFN